METESESQEEEPRRVRRRDFLGTDLYRPKKRARYKSNTARKKDVVMKDAAEGENLAKKAKKAPLVLKGLCVSSMSEKEQNAAIEKAVEQIRNPLTLDSVVISILSHHLWESNEKLLGDCLRAFGRDRIADWLVRTLKIEREGGMLTKSGSRRRTTGGVFINLIKREVSKTEIRSISEATPFKGRRHKSKKRFMRAKLASKGRAQNPSA